MDYTEFQASLDFHKVYSVIPTKNSKSFKNTSNVKRSPHSHNIYVTKHPASCYIGAAVTTSLSSQLLEGTKQGQPQVYILDTTRLLKD